MGIGTDIWGCSNENHNDIYSECLMCEIQQLNKRIRELETDENKMKDYKVSLADVANTLQYILQEAANKPDDCLHCIVNEALDGFEIPLFVSGDKLSVKLYEGP